MGELRVRVSELSLAMCVGAVLTVETLACLFKGVTCPRLVVVVWNTEHLALGIQRKLVSILAKFLDTMSEHATGSSWAIRVRLKVLAKGSFVPGADGWCGRGSGNFVWTHHTKRLGRVFCGACGKACDLGRTR